MQTPSHAILVALLGFTFSAHAGPWEQCRDAANDAVEKCETAQDDAKKESNAATELAKLTLPAGQSIAPGSATEKQAAVGSAKAYRAQKEICDKKKKRCKECKPEMGSDAQEKDRIAKKKQFCDKETERLSTKMGDGATAFDQIASGADAVHKGGTDSRPKDSNQDGNNQAEQPKNQQQAQQQPPPPPPPQQQQPEQPQQENNEQQPTPSNSATGETKTAEKREAPQAAGFATPASATEECKKNPNSDVCRAMKKQEQMVTASSGSSAIPSAGIAPASVAAAGGASGAAGGSAGGHQSLVDADKLLKAAEQQGSREGQSIGNMGADGGGGFSGYGGGLSGSDSEPSSSGGGTRAQSIGGRSISSAPTAANATDIEKRYGPSVVHIVSDNLKNKCDQGRFMHCEPKR